ncbi:14536_t:CDS:1, partial [Dentiscutata erythropus]
FTLDKPHTKEISAKETLTKKISRKKKVSINKVEYDTKVSSHIVEKNISSIDNAQSIQTLSDIFRRKADLEKLIKDTEKLAPMCLSLPQ